VPQNAMVALPAVLVLFVYNPDVAVSQT